MWGTHTSPTQMWSINTSHTQMWRIHMSPTQMWGAHTYLLHRCRAYKHLPHRCGAYRHLPHRCGAHTHLPHRCEAYTHLSQRTLVRNESPLSGKPGKCYLSCVSQVIRNDGSVSSWCDQVKVALDLCHLPPQNPYTVWFCKPDQSQIRGRMPPLTIIHQNW